MAKDLVSPLQLIVIGGSAGSLEVILQALPRLPDNGPPIVIVLHRRAVDDSALIELLSARAPIPVKEAMEKEKPCPGTIHVAPADYHLLIEKDGSFSLDYSEKVNHSRPAIDVTFQTAADAYGAALCVVLLSGASDDGAEGMLTAKLAGAITVVQDPGTAEVPFMPQQAMNRVNVDRVVAGDHLAAFLSAIIPR